MNATWGHMRGDVTNKWGLERRNKNQRPIGFATREADLIDRADIKTWFMRDFVGRFNTDNGDNAV